MSEEKIARICWNSNYWKTPSGRKGKSGDTDSYEYQEGYGHEEWNFNSDRVVDGWVYGFLQQFNTKTALHVGYTYNINFYSIEKINTARNRRWWLGKINAIEAISAEKSKEIFKVYKRNGWLAAMEADLKKQNLGIKKFNETPEDSFFNFRYKISNMELLDEPLEFEKSDPAVPSFYYKLLQKTENPSFNVECSQSFVFKPGHNPGKHGATVTATGGKKEKTLFHNEVQTNIFEILKKEYGKNNVGTENELGYQTKIDIVVKNKRKFNFYEIKTTSTAKAAIREALGQIFEYAYWPDTSHASKLIIITTQKATTDCKKYIKRFRKDFNLPLYLQVYDYEHNMLMPLI